MQIPAFICGGNNDDKCLVRTSDKHEYCILLVVNLSLFASESDNLHFILVGWIKCTVVESHDKTFFVDPFRCSSFGTKLILRGEV